MSFSQNLNQPLIFNYDLKGLDLFAKKLSEINKPSDIILLQGELGTGKTTFARLWIKALYNKMKISSPFSIKSPTFPIMISYSLKKYEVYHYDLYRLINIKELRELGIFENFANNISIIEWPEILMENLENKNYYLIKFSFINSNTRRIELNHSTEIIYF